jgi:hypothetical protein
VVVYLVFNEGCLASELDPSPIVRLNRAVAVAEVDGPGVGLAEIDRLAEGLDGYHAMHAARADLLRRLGRGGESRARRTTGPSVSPATLRSGSTSPAAATSSPADRHVEPADPAPFAADPDA